MTVTGKVKDINKALKDIKVRPSCEAPGAKVTYVYDITGLIRIDSD